MITEITPVSAKSLKKAKEILLSGGLVGMPTETVYGLAADARNDAAVAEIFAVKGRPQDNPLIVHVHKNYDLSSLVEITESYVYDLLKAFTPGPITLVLKSRGTLSPRVSCGLDSLAVRIPAHPDCRAFLECVDLPVAAPSANRSKHVSPVTAEHVAEDFWGKIPLVLDGGRCQGGIESTVVNCMGDTPVILREGLVTAEDIRRVAGKCAVVGAKELAENKGPARSPGTKYRHYHPACRTRMFAAEEIENALDLAQKERAQGARVWFLADFPAEKSLRERGEENVLSLGKTEEEIAQNVYFRLREAEKRCDLLIAFAVEERGVLAGVMNRLKKACAE